ncbi:MAG: TatD family deoxyribonuclease [Candidatus Liptonbacteria bacterium]|nr:TatD family deoxyribonuclease [Candidatus Liptonbacteria bacterium]
MYFDAHTHTHFAAFQNDWKEVMERALAAGIWMVNIGTQKDTSKKAVEVAHEFKEGVYAAVGIHPLHTSKSHHDAEELGGGEATKAFTSRGEIFDHDYYLKLARDPKTVAIGECGLDYYHVPPDAQTAPDLEESKVRQKEAFIEHIKLAQEVGKPLMIHCRDGKKNATGPAYDDLIAILEAHKLAGAFVSHSFVRDIRLAKKLSELGSYFTFNGIITFTEDYDETIRSIPLDRILTETDAPYLTPVPYRGKRNEPGYVVEIVKKLAELKNVPLEEMANITFENARRVFNI